VTAPLKYTDVISMAKTAYISVIAVVLKKALMLKFNRPIIYTDIWLKAMWRVFRADFERGIDR
jgi:hypothetical protein